MIELDRKFAHEEEADWRKEWQPYFKESQVKEVIWIGKKLWLIRLVCKDGRPMSVLIRKDKKVEMLDQCVSDIFTERKMIANHAPMDWIKKKDRWWHELDEDRYSIPEVEDLWGGPNDYLTEEPKTEFQKRIHDMKESVARNYDRVSNKQPQSEYDEAIEKFFRDHPDCGWD